jgi:hypothetical protein
MPTEEDIAKFSEGLIKKIKDLTSKIRLYGPNPKDGRLMLEASLVYYTLFNRKRGGEAMWALLKDFEAAKDANFTEDSELMKQLSPYERQLAKEFMLMKIEGKQ